MQGYSSCKQNHLKIGYKCAQISSFLAVKLWNVQYMEVKLHYRYCMRIWHPTPLDPFSPLIISLPTNIVKELLC